MAHKLPVSGDGVGQNVEQGVEYTRKRGKGPSRQPSALGDGIHWGTGGRRRPGWWVMKRRGGIESKEGTYHHVVSPGRVQPASERELPRMRGRVFQTTGGNGGGEGGRFVRGPLF